MDGDNDIAIAIINDFARRQVLGNHGGPGFSLYGAYTWPSPMLGEAFTGLLITGAGQRIDVPTILPRT